jgi:hypothetical protein
VSNSLCVFVSISEYINEYNNNNAVVYMIYDIYDNDNYMKIIIKMIIILQLLRTHYYYVLLLLLFVRRPKRLPAFYTIDGTTILHTINIKRSPSTIDGRKAFIIIIIILLPLLLGKCST